MNKNDVRMLVNLCKDRCFNEFASKKASSIAKEVDLSPSKVRVVMNDFYDKEYVAHGLRVGNAKTFYLTRKGIELVKEFNFEVEGY